MIVALLGPSADLERCEAARDALVQAGITLAYDWPRQVRAMRDAGLADDDLSDDDREVIRDACLTAIDECDLAWWLGGVSGGAHLEAGFAIRASKPIVSSGPQHPIYRCEHFASDFAALVWIVGRR